MLTLSDFSVTCNILQYIAITTQPSNKYQNIFIGYCLIFIASIAIIAIPICCSLGERGGREQEGVTNMK
jgi:hypothetical protein